MSKLFGETDQQYRDRVVNKISPSYCGAKWYNATVWLGNGMTASCHHPQAHKIPLEELKLSYKALHNTIYKKKVRQQMLDGVRPKECEYCWKVEDISDSLVSDRVYKSVIYSEEDHAEAVSKGADYDYDLKTLEIAFDSLCNLACSYCSPQFSSTYASDIKVNGPYQNLVSDGGGAYQHDGSSAAPYGIKNENNPYVEAFIEWWNKELQFSLSELRITGGEALMSPSFWSFVKSLDNNNLCNVRLAVNSNLCSKRELIERLCGLSSKFEQFEIYTSNESFGPSAEYIRDGLDWDEWIGNIHYALSEGKIQNLHMMMTINALCLYSITQFMDEMLKIRKQYGIYTCALSLNILRFPSFQSVITLPYEMRLERAQHIEDWLNNINPEYHLHAAEKDSIIRVITYLREEDSKNGNISSYGGGQISEVEKRQSDFKSFYSQYDVRRGKDFKTTYPMLADWYDNLEITQLKPVKVINIKYVHPYEDNT